MSDPGDISDIPVINKKECQKRYRDIEKREYSDEHMEYKSEPVLFYGTCSLVIDYPRPKSYLGGKEISVFLFQLDLSFNKTDKPLVLFCFFSVSDVVVDQFVSMFGKSCRL